MLEKLRTGAGWGFCLIVVLSACGSGKVLEIPGGFPQSASDNHPVRYIDAKSPSTSRAIEPADQADTAKFVQVEVVEIQNPRGYPATFRVEYKPREGEKIFLGAFSLYPSDNPGTFIVATQGKLKSEGSVIVSLIVPKNYQEPDALKAGIGRIQFLARKDS